LIQDLKLANIHNIAPQKPKIDKITRFALVLPFFTLEQVLLPKNSPWSAQVSQQLTRFPYADHDDIVDSISQFLNYIKQKNATGKTYRIRDV
jgi:predicted phage terminase large subunit-like protein